jgi:plasmid stability protein
MAMTVNLAGEVADALQAEAARRGQSPDRVAADLLAAGLLTQRAPQTPPGGVRRVSAADAEAMLAEGFGRDPQC